MPFLDCVTLFQILDGIERQNRQSMLLPASFILPGDFNANHVSYADDINELNNFKPNTNRIEIKNVLRTQCESFITES